MTAPSRLRIVRLCEMSGTWSRPPRSAVRLAGSRSQTSASTPPSTSTTSIWSSGQMTTGADEAELAAVGEHHDLTARAADHGELDRRHRDAGRRETGSRVEAVGSEERLVGVEVLRSCRAARCLRRRRAEGGRGRPGRRARRCRPRASATAARLCVTTRASRSGSMWRSMCDHRRARAQEDGVVRLDHGGGGPGDAVLLGRVGHGVLFVAIGSSVSCLPAHGAAVGAGEHALLFEEPEVAADRDLRRRRGPRSGWSTRTAGWCSEGSDDARAPFGRQHLANVLNWTKGSSFETPDAPNDHDSA